MPRRLDHLRAASAAALAGVVLCACASSQSPRIVSAAAASRMHADLGRVEASAGAHDPAAATHGLNLFAAEVARENAAGHLTRSLYTGLETGIARARARIGAEVSAPAAPAAAVAPPPAAVVLQVPAAPAARAPAVSPTVTGIGPGRFKADKGNRNGKGKGGGHGQGGD